MERPIRSTRNLTINYNEDEPIPTGKQRLKIFHDTDTYANKRMYISKSDIPGHTGYGGFANRRLKRHEIIGEYKGGPRITLRNKNKTALSSYAFEDAQNKRIVDPYDPITGEVACSAARINDNIQDPSRWNCEFYIKGKKIFIRATREIQEDEELYLPYGALYWCDPQYPLDILILAQQAYGKQNDSEWTRLINSKRTTIISAIAPVDQTQWNTPPTSNIIHTLHSSLQTQYVLHEVSFNGDNLFNAIAHSRNGI
jgi:hypothetical protein